LLAGFVVAFGMGVLLYRRWMRREDGDASGQTPWTLQQLRELRDAGEITIPEFERLKAAMLGSASSRVKPAQPPVAPNEGRSKSGD
jgi:hypothetical protein